MPPSQAQVTNGITLRVGDGAVPEVFTILGEVVDADPPAGEAPEIDCTHLGSAAREFKFGLRDNGSCSMNLNLLEGDVKHQQLEDDSTVGTVRNYKLVWANGLNGRAFAAGVKQFKIAPIAVDGILRAAVVLRVTGAVTRL